jgi:putative ABC transport system permease protein
LAATLPLNDARFENPIRREGSPTRVQTFQNLVSPRYFEAMNIPLLGRPFNDGDSESASRVAILNQTRARAMWGDESPLGKRLTLRGQPMEVVGVVRDIKGRNVFESSGPMLYVPLSQQYQPAVVLHIRSAIPPSQIAATVRREIQALDVNVPVAVASLLLLIAALTASYVPAARATRAAPSIALRAD